MVSPQRGRTRKKLHFATWNVRTLNDDPTNERPERRTALVGRELRRYNIDIAALQETRLAEEGQLNEIGAGYTFFWKGKPTSEHRIHGVGFAIKNKLLRDLLELPTGHNERIITMRLRLNGDQHATVICAYAPTLDSDDDIKETFYSDLDDILSNISRLDKIILLGDFNARVGKDHKVWNGVIGKEGVGSENSNGIRLLSKCAEYGLVITNTIFRQRDRFKTSWQHPRSKHWHLIDYVIVRKQDLRDVFITKAMTGADDCWTDHRLIRSVMHLTLSIQRRKQQKSFRHTFDTQKFASTEIASKYRKLLHQTLP